MKKRKKRKEKREGLVEAGCRHVHVLFYSELCFVIPLSNFNVVFRSEFLFFVLLQYLCVHEVNLRNHILCNVMYWLLVLISFWLVVW